MKYLKMKAKEEYNILLDKGELLEMYPELSGHWIKDRRKFTKIWKQNIEAIRNIDIDFNEF